jgi:hypothetical protein
MVPGTVKDITPQVGDVWDRFGNTDGGYLSPTGTPFVERAIPPANLVRGYHRYKWIKAWDPSIATITQSEVAPEFEQPGGGIQYALEKTSIGGVNFDVQWLIDKGYIVDLDQ